MKWCAGRVTELLHIIKAVIVVVAGWSALRRSEFFLAKSN